MSRLKGTLVLVALVAFGGFVGLWIRRQTSSPALEPDATTRRPGTAPQMGSAPDHVHDRRPPAAQQSTPKASLIVRLRCSGKPVVGADFTLMQEATHQQATYTTGADGAHAILLLPAGEYHVTVNLPEYVRASAHRMVEADRGHEVVIELDRGSILEGTVTNASGRPLEGTLVILVESQGGTAARSFQGTTDASGQYRIASISSGLFDARFRHAGYREGGRQGIGIVGKGQEFRIDMVLMEGRSINGKVVAEDGTPIPGATVIGNNEEIATCRADEQGAFSLAGLGDGPVSAFASAPGYGPTYLKNLAPGSSGVEFRLSKAGEVMGRISSQPLPGRFTVKISRLEPELGKYVPLYNRAYDGAQGDDFRFGDLPAGRYRLEVEAPGFEAQNVPEMDISAGQVLTDIHIRLRKTS
jgi:carboxypeptidase family protein